MSGLRNSIAAQEFGSDWTDPYGVRGARARLEWPVAPGMRLAVVAGREAQRPLELAGLPATGAYEPLLDADSGQVWSLGFELRRQSRALPSVARWDATLRLDGAQADLTASGTESRFARIALDFEGRVPLGRWALASRSIAAAVSPGGSVPAQAQVLFGGPVTGPGYGFHALTGSAGMSQRLELQRRVPFVSLNLGRFGRAPSTLVLAPFTHQVIVRDRATGTWQGYPSAGLGLIGLFDLFRLDVARGFRDGRWLLSLDVSRSFWGVM